MLGFFRASKPRSRRDLGWDLHAHLVPAVDDGMRTSDEAIEAISAMVALGYSGCVVTPHIYKDLYNNSHAGLELAFRALKVAVKEAGISFHLHLAAEYFGDEHFIEAADSGGALLAFGSAETKEVLIEFPYVGEPIYWADTLSAIVRRGLIPVIAHPERYRYVCADMPGWLERFGSFPVKYQCELGSLVGQYGRDAARVARLFLDRKLAAYWGSDLHRPSQVDRFIRPAIDLLQGAGPVNSGIAGVGADCVK